MLKESILKREAYVVDIENEVKKLGIIVWWIALYE